MAQHFAVADCFVIVDSITREGHTIGVDNLGAIKEHGFFGLGVVPSSRRQYCGLVLVHDGGGANQISLISLGVVAQGVGGQYKLLLHQFHVVAKQCLIVLRGVLPPSGDQCIDGVLNHSAREIVCDVLHAVIVHTIGGEGGVAVVY